MKKKLKSAAEAAFFPAWLVCGSFIDRMFDSAAALIITMGSFAVATACTVVIGLGRDK